jgi:hypothetical protein
LCEMDGLDAIRLLYPNYHVVGWIWCVGTKINS